ncbi:MAG: hypothetical protein ACE5I9_09025 [Candidatus Methylomirabilales bacterium]
MRNSGITLSALEIKAGGTVTPTKEGPLRFLVAGTDQAFLLQWDPALTELKKAVVERDARATLVGKVQYQSLAAGQPVTLLVSEFTVRQP